MMQLSQLRALMHYKRRETIRRSVEIQMQTMYDKAVIELRRCLMIEILSHEEYNVERTAIEAQQQSQLDNFNQLSYREAKKRCGDTLAAFGRTIAERIKPLNKSEQQLDVIERIKRINKGFYQLFTDAYHDGKITATLFEQIKIQVNSYGLGIKQILESSEIRDSIRTKTLTSLVEEYFQSIDRLYTTVMKEVGRC